MRVVRTGVEMASVEDFLLVDVDCESCFVATGGDGECDTECSVKCDVECGSVLDLRSTTPSGERRKMQCWHHWS